MHSDCDGVQILGIRRFPQGADSGLELCAVHPAVAETDFLQASDLESLMVFDGADELGCF